MKSHREKMPAIFGLVGPVLCVTGAFVFGEKSMFGPPIGPISGPVAYFVAPLIFACGIYAAFSKDGRLENSWVVHVVVFGNALLAGFMYTIVMVAFVWISMVLLWSAMGE